MGDVFLSFGDHTAWSHCPVVWLKVWKSCLSSAKKKQKTMLWENDGLQRCGEFKRAEGQDKNLVEHQWEQSSSKNIPQINRIATRTVPEIPCWQCAKNKTCYLWVHILYPLWVFWVVNTQSNRSPQNPSMISATVSQQLINLRFW